MLYSLTAASFAAIALATAPQAPAASAAGGAAKPLGGDMLGGEIARVGAEIRGAMLEICFAGFTVSLGGEQAVHMELSGAGGRCGCLDGCSLASLHLRVAGLAVKI